MAVFLNKKTLIEVANQIKKSDKKIVLTHGSFDLFHIGHSEMLKVSKKFGDYLIVGLDSDKRIKKYKGYNRPIIPLTQRIEILLENKAVDFVFAIDDSLELGNSYFFDLYKKMKADSVTYGRKYGFEKEIKEREKQLPYILFQKIIHKYDGLQSTTDIINKVLSSNVKT